jgi:hypothetical protein
MRVAIVINSIVYAWPIPAGSRTLPSRVSQNLAQNLTRPVVQRYRSSRHSNRPVYETGAPEARYRTQGPPRCSYSEDARQVTRHSRTLFDQASPIEYREQAIGPTANTFTKRSGNSVLNRPSIPKVDAALNASVQANDTPSEVTSPWSTIGWSEV